MATEARRRITNGVIRMFAIAPASMVLAWMLLWPTNSGVPVMIIVVGALAGVLWGGIEIGAGLIA